MDGYNICANMNLLQIDGDRTLIYKKKNKLDDILDCTHECEVQWPQKHMRSACSYLYQDKKSKYYNQSVPSGMWIDNKGRYHTIDTRGRDTAAVCFQKSWDQI